MEDIREYLESKGLQIKERGDSNVSTHCMFCDEDPSKAGRLYINVDEAGDKYGVFFCFLCNAKGNINTIREHYGDPKIKLDPISLESNPIFEVATRYYEERLLENPIAYKYLNEERGLHDDTIRKARLGWADGGLCNHLIQKGFDPDDIKSTGLVNRFGEDFFNNQITFPYLEYGIARSIRGKGIKKKTISLPGELPIPYGLDSVLGEKTVSVAEGEIDTLTLHQMGYPAIGLPGALTFKKGWEEYLEEAKRVYTILDQDKAGKAGAEKVATLIGPKVRVVELPKKGIDVNDWYMKYGKNADDFQYLMRQAKGGLLISVKEAYDRWTEIEGNPDLTGLKLNVPKLDDAMSFGLLPGQIMTMLARTNSGKCHAKWLEIPTPSGFKLWGDIKVGDEVFGSDGNAIKVTHVFDRGILPSYRVYLSDGVSVQCGLDHLWTVYRRYGHDQKWTPFTLTTEELMKEKLKTDPTPNRRGEYRFILPMIEPVQYPEQELSIGPYTLGALIANGTLGNGVTLTTPDYDVVLRCEKEGYQLKEYKSTSCPRYGISGLTALIRKLGLNVKSAEKFIPYEYLIGSIEQRISLLQGLMDGDGSNVSKNPNSTNKVSVAYHTTSSQLARDVVQLVNSLGGTGVINSLTRKKIDGEEYEDIKISIMLPEEIRDRLFTSRKDIQFNYTNKHVPRRAIVSIEFEGEEEQQCISVEAPDHLYAITENYILTHNTVMSINYFERMRMLYPEIKILYMSLEQTRNEWFERAYRIHNFYHPGATVVDTIDFWGNNFYLVDKNRINEGQLVDSIEQFSYETDGVPDLICVDYLGYYAKGFSGTEYDQVTNAIMGLKGIAKEFQTVLYVPHQANRSGEFGKEPRMDEGRGGGTVEETSDVFITLWNPDQAAAQESGEEQVNKGELFQRIKKSRQGGVNALAKYQFCPLTLAMVPVDDILYERALAERQYALAGDDWKKAVERHLTGNMDL